MALEHRDRKSTEYYATLEPIALQKKGNLTLLLSKFDVAERQLLQAITMFFRDEDPVSIHTLAEAASRILYVITEKQGATSVLTDGDFIKEDVKDSVKDLLAESKFFLEYRGQNTHREFKQIFIHVSLINAVCLYSTIKKKHRPETFAYLVWYCREYPDHVRRDSKYANLLEKVGRALPEQNNTHAWHNFINVLKRGRIPDENITLEYGF